jgi:hypothetical protein
VTSLGPAWRYFRRRGVLATLRTFIRRYVYGAYEEIVIRTRLVGPPVPDRFGDFVFRLSTPADLDRLDELERFGRGSAQRAGVREDDDWLFVACHGDRIVATRRYTRVVPPHGLMARVVQLEPGQVWSADAFCRPEYRNQRINHHFGLFTQRYLASLGYTEQMTAIALDNVPSLRGSRRKGGQPLYHVSYRRRLFYTRLRVSPELPARYWAEVPHS